MKNLTCLNVFHELPNDDSRGIETCSIVVWHLLNWVVSDWRVFIVILPEHRFKIGHGRFPSVLLKRTIMNALLYTFHVNTHLPCSNALR